MRLNEYQHKVDVSGKFGGIIQSKITTISTYQPLDGISLEIHYKNLPSIFLLSLSGSYQDKKCFGELKHFSTEDSLFPANGEFTLRTPTEILQSLTGSYELKLENGVLGAKVDMSRNEKDKIELLIDGLIYTDDISLNVSVDHTFGTKDKIEIATTLQRNTTFVFNTLITFLLCYN